MLSPELLARATGETKPTPEETEVSPSVECTVTEDKDSYVVRIPKRMPIAAFNPCQAKEKNGVMTPSREGYVKLNFPAMNIQAIGRDKDAKEMVLTFPTKAINRFNLFVRLF